MKTLSCSKITITISALFIFCGLFTATSGAATFTVTNILDTGAGSLRQAIVDANANPGSDTITFDPVVFATPQTITLTSAELHR